VAGVMGAPARVCVRVSVNSIVYTPSATLCYGTIVDCITVTRPAIKTAFEAAVEVCRVVPPRLLSALCAIAEGLPRAGAGAGAGAGAPSGEAPQRPQRPPGGERPAPGERPSPGLLALSPLGGGGGREGSPLAGGGRGSGGRGGLPGG